MQSSLLSDSTLFLADVTFRAAAEADIIDLQRFCWSDRSITDVTEFLMRCRGFMLQERGYALVAEKDSHAIGFGMLTQWFRVGEISDLIVTPALQSRGIGTAVIHHLTAAAGRLGIHKLEIGVANSNPRAYALYKRLGFVPDRTTELDFGNGLEPVTYLLKYLPAEDTE